MRLEARFAAWYRDHARAALTCLDDGVIGELDASSTKDGPGLALPICVAGVAGVGKSTLLNALLSDRLSLLPQGGVGSFTAAPIRIVYADEPYLAVRYQQSTASELLAAMTRGGERAAIALQEARLLVKGSQLAEASAEYLVAVLQAAIQGRISERAVIADRGRLSVLANIFTDERPDPWRTWSAGAELPALRHELLHNAAGFLAPLASEIELGWTAGFLDNVQLIDLPGLGVAHDVLHHRTEDALANASSVLLVVDRSGITETIANALKPILSRLAGEGHAGRHCILVAVTHLDQIACERRASEPVGTRRTWQAHFDDLGRAAERLVRGQLAQQLAAVGLAGDSHRARRCQIADSVCVIHVAPLEHRRYHVRDPEERSWLADAEGGGVLRLRRELAALGAAWADAVVARLLEAFARAFGPRSRQLVELLRALQLAANHTCRGEETT